MVSTVARYARDVTARRRRGGENAPSILNIKRAAVNPETNLYSTYIQLYVVIYIYIVKLYDSYLGIDDE